MSSADDFDLDERTPVTDLVDPKRTALEAEVQIARAAHQSVRAEWEKAQQVIASMRVEQERMRREIAEMKDRHRREMRMLETANAKLREGKKK